MEYTSAQPAGPVPARRASGRASGCAFLAALLLTAGPGAAQTPAEAPPPSQPQPSPQPTAMPPLKPAKFDETLAIGGEKIEARKLASRMTVEVMVNGAGPYRFVVDSGADTSVLSRDVAAALQLPAGTPVTLNTMTSSGPVDRVLVDALQLGPTVTHGLELPVLAQEDIGAEGMIGLDALVEQRLMLDFDKRHITVDDASSPAPRYDGEIVVTARLQHGQLILTEVTANGQPVEAVIDTGTEITIANSAFLDQLLRNQPDKDSTITITGVTGVDADLLFGKVARMTLGPVTVRNVAIAFADVPPFAVYGLADRPALLLGTDLMEQFRKVSLDFKARKVRFQLKRCESNTIRIRTAPGYASRLKGNRPSTCAS